MEIRKLILPLLKWWWLVVASTLVAAILSYLYINRQPKIYQTHTTLMIGTTITDPNPTNNEFTLGQQLATAYANIANRQMIRNATMSSLKMDQLPQYLARAVPNTQLIEIAVSDTNPQRAQAVANELATQLISLSPTSAKPEEQERQDFINQRLKTLETQINDTEEEIKKLQEDLGNMISAQEIETTQNQIASLQSKLDTLQTNYGVLLSSTQKGAINTLTIIEPAVLPSSPSGPKVGLTVLLAAALGLILAACEAYLLEYLNDTVKSGEEVARLFPAPILGHIFEYKNGRKETQPYDVAGLHPMVTEAFRVLRTNIEIVEADQALKTILVTSADEGDGKTSVATNLALFIAQKNKRVILLDADLRKPNIHRYFNFPNDKGLADLFSRRAAISDVLKIREDKKLAVITAGNSTPNLTELLGSNKMDQLLSELKEVADFVIIDSPPFTIADAMVLSPKVDGVLLVVRPGHTRKPLAKATMEQLNLVGARLIGVVLNRIPLHGADYYGSKGYLYRSYLDNEKAGQKDKIKPPSQTKPRKNFSPHAGQIARPFKQLFGAIFRPTSK